MEAVLAIVSQVVRVAHVIVHSISSHLEDAGTPRPILLMDDDVSFKVTIRTVRQ